MEAGRIIRKYKTIIRILISVCLALGISSGGIVAIEAAEEVTAVYDAPSGNLEIEEAEDGTIRIVKYTGTETSVVIPDEIDGGKITTIGEAAFFNQTRIENIEIPDTVTTIEDGAFVNCINLTSFTMPDSVTDIGEYIFARDKNLESIKLSQSLKTIPTNTFYGCTGLESITIPEGVTALGDGVFSYCGHIDSVDLPDTLETVGEGIFFQSNLYSLYLPVTTAGHNMLQGATIDGELTFSEQLVEIDAEAFADARIGSIHLPESLSYIDPLAFTNLQCLDVTVEESNPYYCMDNNILYSKDKTSLLRCFSLDSFKDNLIKIPDTVKTIGVYAFYQVSCEDDDTEENYVKVELPTTVESIGEHAFQESCISQINIPDSVEIIPDSAFYLAQSLSQLKLGNGIKSIGEFAFAGTQITSVKIPETVTSIDPSAFLLCMGLTDFIVDENNENYQVKNRCIYDLAGETLLTHLCADEAELNGGTFVIPEGTKTIGEKAFCYSKLGNVIIPDSVTSIGSEAFYGCTELHTLKIPSSVTSFGEKCVGINKVDTETMMEEFIILAEADSEAARYAMHNNVAVYTEELPDSSELVEMNTGDTIYLDQTGIVPGSVQYTSEDEKIAYCDAEGNVKALAPGDTRIIRSCGVNNMEFSVHVTGETVSDGYVPTEIQIGKDYGFDPSDYEVLSTDEEYDAYLEEYMEYNQEESFDPLDNECTICYSGNEYHALLAARGDKRRIAEVANDPASRHPELFNLISDGLCEELSRFHACRNVVFYRGIRNIEEITGTGSSVSDMKSSIGNIYIPQTNLSTTLDYNTAARYAGADSEAAVIEIYAPKELLNGSYIDGLSQFKGEKEYLINEGAKFLILDAGVRTRQNYESAESKWEKYVKLLLVN